MESVLLSIKEEIADETKYGISSLHPDIGVLEEDSNKVMRCNLENFQILFFIVSLAISRSFCRLVRCLARCL